MISYIKGKVVDIESNKIIIENNNIGYELFLCENSIYRLKKGEVFEFFVYTSFSMYDGFKLYGFIEKTHLDIFNLLISSIPNTGSKKAMEYLNKIIKSPSEFKKAILTRDYKTLKNLFGFTSKTSEKLILALKDKINELSYDIKDSKERSITTNYETVINALVSLGYKVSEAKEALNETLIEIEGEKTIEELIKLTLRKIASKR